jgi:hypothetical protein
MQRRYQHWRDVSAESHVLMQHLLLAARDVKTVAHIQTQRLVMLPTKAKVSDGGAEQRAVSLRWRQHSYFEQMQVLFERARVCGEFEGCGLSD